MVGDKRRRIRLGEGRYMEGQNAGRDEWNWGTFQGLYRGNSLESTMVTLAKTSSNGSIEHELAICCYQAREVVGLRHQPRHKTFDLKFDLPKRCAGIKVGQNFWEYQTNDWSNLRLIPQEGAHT